MQLQAVTPTTIPTAVQRVADHYRADLVALGASEVVAKPAGVLVVAADQGAGAMLAALLDGSPHDVRMQVAVGSSEAVPATPGVAAIGDAIAGARLAGVTAVSVVEGGVVHGMRIKPAVRVHVADERRAAELDELLRSRVGMTVANGIPQPQTGVSVRSTTDAPKPGALTRVIELQPA